MENERISLKYDIPLLYFAELQEKYPDFIFSNTNRYGMITRRLVYIYPKTVRRKWPDLFEVCLDDTFHAVTLYCRREYLTEEENREVDEKDRYATEKTGTLIRKWTYPSEILQFIDEKLGQIDPNSFHDDPEPTKVTRADKKKTSVTDPEHKPKRGRPRKVKEPIVATEENPKTEESKTVEPKSEEPKTEILKTEEPITAMAPEKRKRGRPKTVKAPILTAEESPKIEEPVTVPEKRKRGRPKKSKESVPAFKAITMTEKRKPGRPKKKQ